ncbi:MAG: hypothetical protein ACLS43_05105 [Evtepia gabavorous]
MSLLSGAGHPGGPEGGTAYPILNGANELAVERFLARKIGFADSQVVEAALDTVPRRPR